MSITISDSVARPQADEVLALVKALATFSPALGIMGINIYENCRERGYHINYYVEGSAARAVSFSENRNSDDIVVYVGSMIDFAPNTNIPNEEVYHNGRKYFKYQDFIGAANFIFNYLVRLR